MNHRAYLRLSAFIRRALPWVSLLLLPGLTPAGTAPLLHVPVRGRVRPPGSAGATPFLPIVGPPPLRFQESLPPPDLVARPPAAAPPLPSPEEAAEWDCAMAEAVPAGSATVTPTPAAAAEIAEDAQPGKKPIPILHDHLRPAVRIEDFLPYFQFPGVGHGRTTVIVPTALPPSTPPIPMPPSSATYTRTPE